MPKDKKTAAPSVAEVKEALSSWASANQYLRDATEGQAKALLDAERRGKKRVQYLLRAHARYNRCRADRERAELLGSSKQ